MGLGDLSVTQSLFGSGSSPGVFGTGQQRFNAPQMGNVKRDANGNPIIDVTKQPGESDEDYTKRAERFFNGDASAGNMVYETDPYKAWQDPQADARRAYLNQQTSKYEGRQAPTMQAAQADLNALERVQGANVGQAERFGGAQIGQYERGQQAQLSPAERVGQQNIGQASTYSGAQVDAAAQARAAQLGRQDQQFRAGQTGLMSQLQEQAAGRGSSLAGGQLQEASERTLAQQAGAAAAGGGSAALARRQLATNAAQQNQQTARDVSQVRLQEQLAARQQLAGVAQTGREQDINVANAQAQLAQQANLANQAAINSRAAQQAGLTQQAGMFSAEQLNQRQYQQAQLNAQLALANQQAGNQFALQQGQFGQQMNLANMQAYNERQALQAQLGQQAGLANQQYANQFMLQQAQLNQQANLANQQYYNQGMFQNVGYQQQANQSNLQANLQQQALNDAMARYYTEAGLGLDARQQQAMMAYQGLQQQAALGYAGLEQKAYEGAREGVGGFMGGIGSAVGALAMFSDEEVKNSVTRGNDKISSFLDQYMSGIENMSQQYSAPEPKKSGGGLFGGMGGAMTSAGMASAMGSGGAGAGAGAAAAAGSDKQMKDLSAENDKLKAQMVGMSMSQGAGGKGFLGGLGSGIAQGAQAKYLKDQSNQQNFQKKADPSSQMTPVMNNPNAAVAVPGGMPGAGVMSPSYGGLAVRQNPYGAVPMMQTPSAQPAPVPPTNIPSNMTDAANPYGPPLQTWSDVNTKSYSPIGMKQGISSGDMRVSNFLNTMYRPADDDTATAGSSPMMMPRTGGANPMSGPSGGGVGPTTMMYSDVSTKKKVDQAIDEKLGDFLDNQEAYEYEYKPEYKDASLGGPGRYVSPMAQDLMKTDLGKTMVKQGPDGKMVVDYGKGFGVLLASQAYLNDRLNELEAKKGKK